jgi:putative FmdB family regulatory protein
MPLKNQAIAKRDFQPILLTMPTYDYVCRSCNEEFEIFQSIKEDRLKDCPKCDAPAMDRLIGTGAGIIFKGSGFYETDYRKQSQSQANGSSSSEGKAKAEGESGKKDGGEKKTESAAAASASGKESKKASSE